MKKTVLFLGILSVWVCCFSCEKPPTITKAQVIQNRLNDRLIRWKSGVHRNCRNDVMEAAIAIVDSTFLADARLKRDTSNIPDIPGRPTLPSFTPPSDTTPVKPILSTNELDSLGK